MAALDKAISCHTAKLAHQRDAIAQQYKDIAHLFTQAQELLKPPAIMQAVLTAIESLDISACVSRDLDTKISNTVVVAITSTVSTLDTRLQSNTESPIMLALKGFAKNKLNIFIKLYYTQLLDPQTQAVNKIRRTTMEATNTFDTHLFATCTCHLEVVNNALLKVEHCCRLIILRTVQGYFWRARQRSDAICVIRPDG
jgi:hypothetical protein